MTAEYISRAMRKGAELRRKLRWRGEVDAEHVAHILGMTVISWPMQVQEELQVDGYVAVAERLDSRWRRWVIAHAIGHRLMHPGNHMLMRANTWLGHQVEREAEDFAAGLLMDADEALAEGMTRAWEIAEYFGVPEEMVRLQPAMRLE